VKELLKRGCDKHRAISAAMSRKSFWRLARTYRVKPRGRAALRGHATRHEVARRGYLCWAICRAAAVNVLVCASPLRGPFPSAP
jgi:hypothetical protein